MIARRFSVPAGSGELQLDVSSVTHVGLIRQVNEDAILAEPPVFAVADGMGGHAFGDRASATAVLALHEEFDPSGPAEPGHVLTAIRRANAAVRELTAWAGGGTIAGTTLTGVALVAEDPQSAPRWMVFNLGDSRVYRWDGAAGASGVLERISVDHSVVQELLDAGLIDEERARVHPDRNVITRALGAADEVAAEAWLLPATPAQSFLICSDGLTKELDDKRIAALLGGAEAAGDPASAVDRLLDAALDAGGSDNISIVLVAARYRAVVPPAVLLVEPVETTHDRELSPELTDTRPRI